MAEQQVARDRNGKEIKVGDRVRCVLGWEDPRPIARDMTIKEGAVYTLGKTNTYGHFYLVEKGNDFSYDKEKFELVDEESELERLVRKANEGMEAGKQLHARYSDQLEERVVNLESGIPKYWQPYDRTANEAYEYRVKPRPTFTPFTVGLGWKVELKDNNTRLQIGCRDYAAHDFMKGLRSLVRGGNATASAIPGYASGIDLHATRLGVLENGQSISWDEAEKILKALEVAGV
jgi:hypothetical protein